MNSKMLGLLMLAAVLAVSASAPAQADKTGTEPAAVAAAAASKPAELPRVSLDSLVALALADNPSIRAAAERVEARRARVRPEATLDDPVLSFQTMGDLFPPNLQQGDPSSGRTYAVEQELPFPGKLELKGKIAEAEVEAEALSYEQTRRRVVAELKGAYYDYFLICKSLQVLDEDAELLRHFEQIAQAKYRVGQGEQQDVLKAEVEISRLIDRRTVLEQRRRVVTALLNTLVYRDPETPLGEPVDLHKAPLIPALDELQQLALAAAPGLNRQDREIERGEYAVKLARLNRYPDFALGFGYVDRDQLPGMYGFTVKAKIPLYSWRKQEPELAAARSNLAGARRERENQAATLRYQVRQGVAAAEAADRLIRLYQEALIPQSSHALEAAIASYQVGATDFLSLIDSLTVLLEYQLKYYQALTDYQKALAELEPLVGIELTGRP